MIKKYILILIGLIIFLFSLDSEEFSNHEKQYTMDEVSKHNTREDMWTVINGNVYKIPESWINEHPGGDQILNAAGIDATDLFEGVRYHGSRVEERLETYKIGILKV